MPTVTKAKINVVRLNTKETATATTRTTTAAAITTVAIAVKQQPKVEKLRPNSANNANAWTRRINPTVTKAKINVVRLNTKETATATTITTTVVANTTAVIAARKHSR